ncbi:MAG: signal peptidase I [Chloroflexi bacterium]|nr:MAG: signal peptidase I [Chloroflexota bacterium]RLC86352.1 MAG: signal peptidase I [Chloroflexota bacterium]HEY68835.1 signal peptidase I [Thermoflexia bacterium]
MEQEQESVEEFKIEAEQEPRGSGPQVGRWLLQALREVAETVIPAVAIALVINLFLAQATQVLGQSMEPNLHTSQRVVVEKVTYRFVHGPRRGDIVVINLPGQTEMLIKRVVGLPGETVEVRRGEVYIDGKRLDEPWKIKPGGGNYGPQIIPPLHVFVLGDNRGASNDSRSFGPVPIECIVGHAWFSYWPPEYIGFVE